LDDNLRRKVNYSSYIKNKIWLDFGCGLGGMLDQMEGVAKEALGLEPNKDRAQFVAEKGHKVVASMNDIDDHSVDVITLFHVLEHLVDIDEIFLQIRRCLKDNGVLIVEVPHARDILFTTFDCDDFKKFTFWSEHLVLHTRNSLHHLLNFFKFSDVQIQGIQRYPLSNHMYWLSKGLPGGHEIMGFLDNDLLDMGYQMSLQKIDRSDTLVAICRK
jgi:2-polyprenyl-3-methyl-5-hydroxy-6-metoxy-1,4-benzoquinol methylase